MGFAYKINSLEGRRVSGGFLAQGLRLARINQENIEAPLRKGKPVVRLGRKATDQVNHLRAGLPKRGVVDLKAWGLKLEELRPYVQDLVFFGRFTADSFRRYIPLCPEPFVMAYFCSVLFVTGEGGWAAERWL